MSYSTLRLALLDVQSAVLFFSQAEVHLFLPVFRIFPRPTLGLGGSSILIGRSFRVSGTTQSWEEGGAVGIELELKITRQTEEIMAANLIVLNEIRLKTRFRLSVISISDPE